MTVALHEPCACGAVEELRPDALPTDDVVGWDKIAQRLPAHHRAPDAEDGDPEKSAEPPVPRRANPRRRTILSQLLALCAGPQGRAIDTQGLCVDLPGEDDRITIDDEFALACPKVAKEEALALERNLVKSKRCKDRLVLWTFKGLNILLEGHHRLFYCLTHRLPFRVDFVDLPSREAALQSIRDEQIGRRNLSDVSGLGRPRRPNGAQ